MSKPNKITIDEVEYVRADSVEPHEMAKNTDGLRYCIVRCHDAGVHAGYVRDRDGREVELVQTRRLWRWYGKTLSGLALEGTTDPDSCKFSDEIPEILVLDACEVIPCTEKAMKSLRGVKGWVND